MASEAVCLLTLNSVEESNDFDESNGLILNDISVPIELIQRIMGYTDEKTLLNCRLVCKRWNVAITEYVWRKKAEIKTGHRFSTDIVWHWSDFYLICAKNLFKRNVLKNHSGEEHFKQWILLEDDFVDQNMELYSGSSDSDDSSDNDSSSDEDSNASVNSERNIQVDGENGNDTKSEIESDNESADRSSGKNDRDDRYEDNGSVNSNDSEHDPNSNNDNENMLDVIEVDGENESNGETDSHDVDTDESDHTIDHFHDYNYYVNGWIVECPPVGAPPPPPEPEFEGKEHCFVTTYYTCYKEQVIDLLEEGFSVNILDELRPPIEINEWYCSRFDCPATYNLRVRLLNQSNETLDEFIFSDILQDARQNIWFNVKHEFKNYGKGLRKIRFVDGGCDRRFWAGHYGSKMAGAYVKVKL